MRDLMFLVAVSIFVPMAFTSPFRAYLLWGWTALIGINFYLYGFMVSLPFNFIFGVLALSVILLRKDTERGGVELSSTVVYLSLFVITATLSAALAYPGLVRNWDAYFNLLKTVAFCIVMPILLTGRYRVHTFVLMLALALAIHGLLEGLKTIVTAGGHHVVGIAKFGDNNHMALILVMTIPLLFYINQYSANKFVRFGSLVAIGLLVAAVIGTNSRGGLVSLIAVGGWLILMGRRKTYSILLVLLGIFVVYTLAPENWWNRMETIKAADQDSSFMGRVIAWKISSAIALANPILGGGFFAIENQSVWTKFSSDQGFLWFVHTPDPDIIAHAAHSIYFQLIGDVGFLGFFIYVLMLINVFVSRIKIKKRVGILGSEYLWVADLADAIVASLIAFLIGGAAVSMAYNEMVFIFVMLMDILNKMTHPKVAPVGREIGV